MPIYARDCKACKHHWDHLTLSFSGADTAEKEGVSCPRCGSQKTRRITDPGTSMKNTNPLPKRYGLHTYT